MLDLFSIFSKGGIVLWCFQGTSQLFTPSVNALIRSVILQERTGNNTFNHENLTLQYKLDNEFELVFVVAYQKILQLSYIDKFLNDIHLEFRDKYKDDLTHGRIFQNFDFGGTFKQVLKLNESQGRKEAHAPKQMKTFDESAKSKKTVASMIENKKDTKVKETKKEEPVKPVVNGIPASPKYSGGDLDAQLIMQNRKKMEEKLQGKGKPKEKAKSPQAKKGKSARVWENSGSTKESVLLDFSNADGNGQQNGEEQEVTTAESRSWVGQMKGELQGLEVESGSESEEEEEDEDEVITHSKSSPSGKTRGFGMFNMFKTLVGSKSITREVMEPILEKLREHMIGKNVAAEIAEKLCESVAVKLEGKVLGTFGSVTSTVKATLTDALVKLLTPRRRIDILRDVMESQRANRPFVVTFCGVNGVGKSTNLAKIAFWLVENNLRVMIAACDTFRAGAVEQLRTHARHLNALHPATRHNNVQMVQLYEKGYGKDAAGIAMEAINSARDMKVDVVLVDTAGRMQDNEPLMRALAKLIKVNQPDLVLFVGEALVGNEAVDQLVKFNQALADHSSQDNPHLIDGIVLTKFDTIDDKVGAAISMTYTTGQPIVFVGTGQTYTDLKNLNVNAVVHALMK